MDFKRIAVIGVDCISASIALRLKAQQESPEVVGTDSEAGVANLAHAQGAFDRVERKPERACRDADLVIVAVPLSGLRETFAAIAPHLKPGCLITDTAPLKAPVLRWADELLPEGVSFAGGHPVPNPNVAKFDPLERLERASADLLRGGLYCFVLPPRIPNDAVDALIGLARTLGAYPFFMDATEHDGMQAGVEELPDLLAVALLRATVGTPGWQEMRKFAGSRFAATTEAATREPTAALCLNRENVLLRLDILLSELALLRDLLAQDDTQALQDAFATAVEGRTRWIEEREKGLWLKEFAGAEADHLPSTGERLGQFLFGGLGARAARK